MLRWYLVQTKPSSEALAQTNLRRQGYEVYLPLLAQTVRSCGRWRERVAALFPRYLFVRLCEGQQSLAPVRSSVGVSNVVRFGSSYSIVPDRIVSALRAQEEPSSGLHRLALRSAFAVGSLIRVTAGVFEGLEGIFEREDGADRVVVLLNLLGRHASVRIPIDAVDPRHA